MTSEALRAGVLDGVRLLVAGTGAGELGRAVIARAERLGAVVRRVEVDPAGDEVDVEGDVDVLVWDGAAGFSSARAALDGAWLAVRPAATRAMPGGGLVVLLAPPPGDAHAEAARAGLENMARTLSIEWARLGIRPVAVLPGTATDPGEVAELVAFLASAAGAYYSGCRFELR